MNKILAWIEDGLWAWRNGWTFRFNHYNDNIDRLAFFEEISNGWYHMYIYPYDDMYMPIISAQRKLFLAEQPITFYVSEEDYDAMFNAINDPPEPSEALLRLWERKIPWDVDSSTGGTEGTDTPT